MAARGRAIGVGTPLSPSGHGACRHIGGDKVPEFWGKPSAYTEGTTFLGTPKDHLKVGVLLRHCGVQARVRAARGTTKAACLRHAHLHYKFPLGAISSIINRVTGVALSVGEGAQAATSAPHGRLCGPAHTNKSMCMAKPTACVARRSSMARERACMQASPAPGTCRSRALFPAWSRPSPARSC